MPHPVQHDFDGHFFRKVIVLIAITTIDIAAAYRDDMRLHNVIGRRKPFGNEAELAKQSLVGGYAPFETERK